MTLRASELAQVVDELWPALKGAVVQHAFSHRPGRAWLELRLPGKSLTLHLCAEQGLGRLSVVDAHPKGAPGEPLSWQQVLRRELTGARVEGLRAAPWGCSLFLLPTGEGAPKGRMRGRDLSDERTDPSLRVDEATSPLPSLRDTLSRGERVLQLELPTHSLLLLASGRVLAASSPGRPRLGPGAEYAAPDGKLGQGPSRLKPQGADFPAARAAEALLGTTEGALALKAARAPLESKLKRLTRTVAKVELEAARAEEAERHRRDGELLKQNLHRLSRGAKSVTFDEYLPDGRVEPRTVKLDPARAPRLQAEWHFHQYRRLLRGAAIAAERLKRLNGELLELRARIGALEASPLPAVAPPRPKKSEEARPYREYQGQGGRIWVGKGAAGNDTLTFKLGRPHHLWLHARGVTGAHVVVPLEKNAAAPQELLLDAAHLAAHHSEAKGEQRAEVSYTQVKYVKKVKGVAGAVTFTREKTFLLRLEPARLERLLATES